MSCRKAIKVLTSGLIVVIALLAIVVTSPNKAQAYHSTPMNAYENYAKTGSGSGLGQNPSCPQYPSTANIGVTWLSDSPSSVYGFQRTSGGYNVINVEYGQRYRTVYIRGSIYGCAGSSGGNTAVEVYESGSNYLSNLSSSSLPRGSNTVGTFSDAPGYISAQLDTVAAGLALDNGNGEVTITVKINRCFSYSSIEQFGWAEACGVSYIPIILHRDAPPWEADATTEIKSNQKGQTDWKTGRDALKNIRPTQTLTWHHRVFNTSETDAPNVITVTPQISYNGGASWQTYGSSATKQGGPAYGTIYDRNTSPYTVRQSDVGNLICGRVGWSPFSGTSASGTWGYSSEACADVPYHYPPGPHDPSDPEDPGGPDGPGEEPSGGVELSADPSSDTVMAGENITFNYHIDNTYGPTKTKNIEYRTYTFILPGGTDLPDNWEDMITYNPNWSEVDCSEGGRDVYGKSYCALGKSGGTGSINPGTGKDYSGTYTVIKEWLGQPGDQICSYIAADNNWSVKNNVSSNSYAASNIACVKIGKRPQIQINGSDSYANKGFTGSKYSDIELNYQRGSYSQYGLLTGSGSSSNFGSAGYTFSKSSNASKACQLGWANTSCNNSFSAGGLTHTFYNAVTVTDTTSYPGSLSSLSSPSGGGTSYYQASGGTNFSGNLNPGTRAVVYVNGDANITGNIIAYGAAGVSGNLPTNPDAGGSTNNLNQTFTNLVDIPSLTIVATGDININGSVTTIDANLVSKNGRVITCAGSDGGGTKTKIELGIGSTQCANKLKINGAVASKESPILHRIFGAGNTIDTTSNTNQWNNLMNSSSSEWFNYTPNVWLTPYLNGGGDTPNNYTTVQVTNLPVRY